MSAPHDLNRGTSTSTVRPAVSIEIPQYRLGKILAVWAAAAIPMGVFAWVVAPQMANWLSGEGDVPLVKSVLTLLTVGLVWQFALVIGLVWREQRTLRWSVVREALWLRAPRSPSSGRIGGRVWSILIPLCVAYIAVGMLMPSPPAPADRDLGLFLESDVGHAFFQGAWGWFALTIVMMIFNTVLGEELLFRGLLLPRMNRVFGRADWAANGVLFAAYHMHVPWAMPSALLDSFILAYPTKRYRSTWIGIVVHSTQTLFFGAMVLAMVM